MAQKLSGSLTIYELHGRGLESYRQATKEVREASSRRQKKGVSLMRARTETLNFCKQLVN